MYTSHPTTRQRIIGMLAAFSMVVATVSLAASGSVDAAPGSIDGTIFRDHDWDGARAGDTGQGDIEVTVTDTAGTMASAISAFDGTYSVDLAPLATGPYTVSFAVPATHTYLSPGPLGTDNRSDIRVVAAAATGIDFGVVNPFDYCQANPDVVTNCYVEFDQINGPNAGGAVLVETEYLASGDGTPGGGGTPEFALTEARDIGSTFGLAIQNFNDSIDGNDMIYASALLKRFAGFGPGGVDAIYQLDRSGTVVNTLTSIDAGTHVPNFGTVSGDIPDAASYAEVGKQGWGDIDVSDDGTRLYAVNLFDKRLYEIDIDGGATASFAITNSWSLTGLPSQTCTAGEIRPWAVGFSDGEVYVGSVCDGAGGATSSLVAHVHRMTPSVGTFSHVQSIPLNFARQPIGGGTGYPSDWGVWNDSWAAYATGWYDLGFGEEHANPQPILTDIEFDQGDLVLGFRDRYGDQSGFQAPSPLWPGGQQADDVDGLFSTDSGGDVLRLCRTGGTTWETENATTCVSDDNDGEPNSGPGGREYYSGDEYITVINAGPESGHDEIALGGLAKPGTADDLIATGYDTLDDNGGAYAFSNGLFRLDDANGDKTAQYRVVAGVFGKAAGLGDIEAFCHGAPVEIGNYIWNDVNHDGIQDPDEAPLEGIAVTLVGGSTVVTGPDGYYSFTVAANSNYTLTIDPSGAVGVAGADLLLSPQTIGSNAELDSNAYDNAGVFTVDVATGEPGHNDHSFDIGLFEPAARIGNLVWLDQNDNGTPDDGEFGVEGLAVELYLESGDIAGFDAADTLADTTSTDAEGNYWFESPSWGDTYYVALPEDQSASPVLVNGSEVNAMSLMSSTGGTTGENDDDNGDDGEPATGYLSVTGPIVLADDGEPSNEADANTDPDRDAEDYVSTNGGATSVDDDNSNLTVDLGLTQKVRIGNKVWLDSTLGDATFNDGVADPAESSDGIGNVELTLFVDDDGTPGIDPLADSVVGTATTDTGGTYYFEPVAPGTYFVGIAAGQTGQTIDGATVDLTTLTSSTAAQSDADAGIDDVDDGDPIAGWASMSGAIVVDFDDNPVDENGDFSGGVAGDAESAANAAGFDYLDSNSDLTIDFSFVEVPLYRLGNLIWWDIDDDGVASDGEPGIEGVTVELWLDGATSATATDVTDADGKYDFADIAAGDYFIVVPAGQTGQTVGGQAIDLEDLAVTTTAAADPDNPSDVDNDNNGIDNAGAAETGVVSVGDPNQFVPAEPQDEVLRADGAAALVDDDADLFGDAQSNYTVDIGFVQPVRIGNVVWLDDGGGIGAVGFDPLDENDGQADGNESGIEGVLVQLLDDTGTVIAETTTDATGTYLFTGLDADDYQVGIPSDQTPTLGAQAGLVVGATDGLRSSVPTSTDPEDGDDDDDGDPATDYLSIAPLVNLDYAAEADDELGDFADTTPGAAEGAANTVGPWLPDTNSNLEVDFGLAPVPTYRIGNLVWEDYDNDGLAEDGEPGIAGVLVQLLDDADQVIAETVTGTDGKYVFEDLIAGDYRVQIPTDQTPVLGAQAGIVADALDGLETSGSPISDPDFAGDADNTNDGVSTIDGFLSGVLTVGEGDDHSEIEAETLRDDVVTLDEDGTIRDDRSNLAVDFGFFAGLRLGNQVFLDGVQGEATYNNGVFDAGEDGIAGVAVELWIDDGSGDFDPALDTLVTSVTTDIEGNYSFVGLDEGVSYFVAIESLPTAAANPSSTGVSSTPITADNDDDGAPAAGYAAVSDVVVLDTDDNDDAGDGNTTGEADTVPAESAEDEANVGGFVPDGNSELSVDFGFVDVPLYRLGNLVWEDINHDGLAQSVEPGIEGVLVQLLDSGGNVIGETATDVDGKYWFENLTAGDYDVRIPEDQIPVGASPAGFVAGALDGFTSSTNGEVADPNTDADNDDNGIGATDHLASGVALGETLALPPAGDEPTDEDLRVDDTTDDDPDVGVAGSYPDDLSNLTVDFGFYRLTLGNQVWFDANDNGIIEFGEAGIDGVQVNLYEDDGLGLVLVDSMDTAFGGLYLFTGLDADTDYVVEIPASEFATAGPLEGMFSSTDPVAGAVDADGDEGVVGDGVDGDDNGEDPGGSGSAVQSLPVTLFAADEPTSEAPDNSTGAPDANQNLTVDFGFHNGLRLGSLVWLDDGSDSATDENGIADSTESGVADVTVELYEDDGTVPGEFDSDDTLVTSVETGTDGDYVFEQLDEGTYLVVIPASELATGGDLAGLASTFDGAEDETTNNDDDGVTESADGDVVSYPIVLSFGDEPDSEGTSGTSGATEEDGSYADINSNLSIDFGFIEQPTYRLGNLVWEDIDHDGLAQSVEPGIGGVLVQLLDDAGDPIAEVLTDTDGHYDFDGLEAGDYQVRIPVDQTPVVDLALVPTPNALSGLTSSTTGEEADADGDADNDDNGLGLGDWTSGVVEVGEGGISGEPETETLRVDDPTDDDDDGPAGQADGRSNYSIDFGFYRLTLGNQVIYDWNNSGDADDLSETGIDGVQVSLIDTADDSVVETLTTEPDGTYLFEGLIDGATYVVSIDAINFEAGNVLDGFHSSDGVNVGADPDSDTTDDDDNGSTGTAPDAVLSDPVTMTVGGEPTGETGVDNDLVTADASENLTVDFGFYSLTVGNQVWLDSNDNGVIDSGESGIEGVTVTLIDPSDGSVLDTVTTGPDGEYLFTGLPDGTYVVELPAENFAPDPDGSGPLTSGALYGLSSSPLDGDPDDVTDDDDDNGLNVPDEPVRTTPFDVAAGGAPTATGLSSNADPLVPLTNQNLNIDLGFHGLSLGNLVFLDTDGNGVFDDATESGRVDVTVELWESDGAGVLVGTDPIATTVTDDEGHYLFTDLEPGEYVVIIPTENFEGGAALFGYGSTVGNGVDAPDGDDDPTDSDDNGDPQLNGEVSSDPVTLAAADEPAGETDISSNPEHVTGVDDSNANLTVDFGFEPRPGVALGNRVWADGNGDGIQDPTESGLDGVRVELYDDEDVLVTFDITDNDGYYLFVGLEAGDYTVVIPAENFDESGDPLWGWHAPEDPAGSPTDPDDDLDGDDDGMAPAIPFGAVESLPVTLVDLFEPQGETDIEPPGDNVPNDINDNLTVDFAFVQVALGSTVWNDLDENGFQTLGEPGIAGVEMQLLTAGGSPVLDGAGESVTTETDADGVYLFDGLAPGDYVVQVPASQFDGIVSPLSGFASSKDNNEPATGLAPDPDEVDPYGDGTSNDADDNGDPVTGDPFSGEAVVSAPVTVTPGDEPVGETPDTGSLALPDGSENLTVDFGFYEIPTFELGGVLWIDADNSGSEDTAEISAPEGVTLRLLDENSEPVLDGNGLARTTTTDPGGTYLFDDLEQGTYIVEVVESNFVDGGVLEGYWPSTGPDVSQDPNDDLSGPSDGQVGEDLGIRSLPVVLYPETEPTGDDDPTSTLDDYSNLTVDFGVYTTEIAAQIWIDLDNDGVVDPGEEAGAGVTVALLDENGEPILDAAGEPLTAVTDATGSYLFVGIPEGTYIVSILPENFAPGGVLDGYVGSKAADNDGFQPDGSFWSQPFDVVAGVNAPGSGVLGAVLGLTPVGAVITTIWVDLDGDGQIGAGEPLREGVEVTLRTADGTVVSSATSNSEGTVEFVDVVPGDYQIVSELPDGFVFSLTDAGGNDALDSDVDGSGVSGVFSVDPGETVATLGVGLLAGDGGSPTGPLAFSGASSRPMMLLGLTIMLLGLALVAASRRRERG